MIFLFLKKSYMSSIFLRAFLAFLTSFFICLMFGSKIIRILKKKRIKQSIRILGPGSHIIKGGTPTMGGILILIALIISTLAWIDLKNKFVWIVLLITICFGWIGYLDDRYKVMNSNSNGLNAKHKFLLQASFGIIAAVFVVLTISNNSNGWTLDFLPYTENHVFSKIDFSHRNVLIIPFFKSINCSIGIINSVLLSWFIIVGSSNSVNLTDGLDGLVSVPVTLIVSALGIFSYIAGQEEYSKYFSVPFIPGSSELLILCAAIAGSCLSFLWFNAHPAKIFMGDVGSLSLGAALGTLSIIPRQEIAFFIMSGLFVIETFSVIIQVSWFKYTKYKHGVGIRIFRMAPLHHHLELRHWKESHIVIRFWIISATLVLIGLASLKV